MDLREAWIGKERPFFVGAIRRRDIAAARICRKIEDVAISTGREHDGVAHMSLDFSGDETARNDALGVAIDQNEVEHLRLRKHSHRAGRDLPAERLIATEQQLLPSLSARVKRPRDLRSAKRSIGKQPAVLAREWHALFDALVDDQIADFGQTINIRFAGTEVAAFNRVVKETKDAVAIVLIIFRGVDAALRGDAVGAARAVLIAERLNVVA